MKVYSRQGSLRAKKKLLETGEEKRNALRVQEERKKRNIYKSPPDPNKCCLIARA